MRRVVLEGVKEMGVNVAQVTHTQKAAHNEILWRGDTRIKS